MNDYQEMPVAVIGAGLAGLTCANHLAARGVPTLLLEADWAHAGGRLSGGDEEYFVYEGQTWTFKPEHGVHALWGGYLNMRATLERFTHTRLIPSVGEEWINRWGREVSRIEAGNAIRARFIPAPFHYLNLLFHPRIWASITPLDFLSLPGILASILLTVGVDPIAEEKVWDGLNMREYFRGWTPNLRATFEGLAANLLAAPLSEIDLSAFVAALRFYTLLRRDSWAMHYLPEDAATSVIRPLLERFEQNEGMMLWGATAKKLTPTPEGWRISVEDALKQGNRALEVREVVLALDAPSAQRLLQDSPATQVSAHAMHFPLGLQNVVVRLWFSAAPDGATQGAMLTGDFAPDNLFWLHRLYGSAGSWHEITGGSIAELHFYEQTLFEQSDQNLLILAVTELTRAFPKLRNHFVHGMVRRNSKTQTRWRVPTAQTLGVQTPWQGIYACGDWLRYPTPSLWMERSCTTAIAAANAVLVGRNRAEDAYPLFEPPPPELPARALGAVVRVGRRLGRLLVRRPRR